MDRPTPDTEDNSEQADAGTQAQDVAADAQARATDPAQIIPDDVPDLVERMNDMNRSGRIDMDAYAGEPQMDDEDDAFGTTEDDE